MYILDTSILSDICLAVIFLQCVNLSVCSFNIVYPRDIFNEIHFFFLGIYFWCYHPDFFFWLSSRRIIVLYFTFRSIVHCELVSVWILHINGQFLQYPSCLVFLFEFSFAPFSKISCNLYESISGLFILYSWSLCSFDNTIQSSLLWLYRSWVSVLWLCCFSLILCWPFWVFCLSI